jgi:hypothetical protein
MLRSLQKINIQLVKIIHKLDLIILKNEVNNMPIDPRVAALVVKFGDAANLIAAKIQKLKDLEGLSVESEAALQAEADKLNLLGVDDSNPLPPDPGGIPG